MDFPLNDISVHRLFQFLKKKKILKQDCYLLHEPGFMALAMLRKYLELFESDQNVEYFCITSDTTVSELFLGKEIQDHKSVYVEKGPLKACLTGQILILDGLHRAERNLLPVLNNLIENREINLDDGRYLIPLEKYEAIPPERRPVYLTSIHPSFRIIALGVPVPPFVGNPLDPPLRSRFQGFRLNCISNITPVLRQLTSDSTVIKKLVETREFISEIRKEDLNITLAHLPSFPDQGLVDLAKIARFFEGIAYEKIFRMFANVYPYYFLKENICQILEQLDVFQLSRHPSIVCSRIEAKRVFFSVGEEPFILEADLLFPYTPQLKPTQAKLDPVLSQMLLSHAVNRDICILGPSGFGKTFLVKQFAECFDYQIATIHIYRDMNARDLIQRRAMTQTGQTIWVNTPLIDGLLQGKLIVLDGADRLSFGVFGILNSLIQDRYLKLFDGSLLIGADEYQARLKKTSYEALSREKIFSIHPASRILCLVNEPNSENLWWEQTQSLFHFFPLSLAPLSPRIEAILISQIPQIPRQVVEKIFLLTKEVENYTSNPLVKLDFRISIRFCLKVGLLSTHFPEEIYRWVCQSMLLDFMPTHKKEIFFQIFEKIDLKPKSLTNCPPQIDITENRLKIGEAEAIIFTPRFPELVPTPLFFDIPIHLHILENMLKAFQLGEHLLLIGDQGTGKNKLTDRLLQLLNREREYIQLNRDTTVNSLTMKPKVDQGMISFEDSPLISALKNGFVVVIDEADKASPEVVVVLKSLIEDGELYMPDGRLFVSSKSAHYHSRDPQVVPIHPHFRSIFLANRPGFPFLGNQFYQAMGDIFCCFPVHNPDQRSELNLLKQYAPSVPEELLLKLVSSFAELRALNQEGQILYPYSLRELVQIVKHLERFPQDPIDQVLANIFDFDSFNPDLYRTIFQTLLKNELPVQHILSQTLGNSISQPKPLPPIEYRGSLKISPLKHTLFRTARGNLPSQIIPSLPLNFRSIELDYSARSIQFTEQSFSFRPFGEYFIIGATTWNRWVVLLNNKAELFLVDLLNKNMGTLDLKLIGMTASLDNALLGTFDQTLVLYCKPANSIFKLKIDSHHLKMEKLSLTQFLISDVYRLFSNKLIWFDILSRKVILLNLSNGEHLFCEISGVCPPKKFFPMEESGNFFVQDEKGDFWDLRISADDQFFRFRGIDSYFHMPSNSLNHFSPLQVSDLIAQRFAPQNQGETEFPKSSGFYIISGDQFSERSFTTLMFGYDMQQFTSTAQCFHFPREKPKTSIHQRKSIWLQNSKLLVNTCSSKDSIILEKILLSESQISEIFVEKSWSSNPDEMTSSSISPVFQLLEMDNGKLILVQQNGLMRCFEFGREQLQQEEKVWRSSMMHKSKTQDDTTLQSENGGSAGVGGVGDNGEGGESINESNSGGGTGKILEDNHFDLDAPTNVLENETISLQNDIDDEIILREAKEKARALLKPKQKLPDERRTLSEDHYFQLLTAIKVQIGQLSSILQSAQAKEKERIWLKNSVVGDLDENKIVDLLSGEKTVFMKRGERKHLFGGIQKKPKRVKFLIDCSRSMSKFNSNDRRLDRTLALVLLIIESFESIPEKFEYSLSGHNGDSPAVRLVDFGKPPKTIPEKIEVLDTIYYQSMYCSTGDNTLSAIFKGIEELTTVSADDYFLFVLSDANLSTYGLSPSVLGKALLSDPKVTAFIVFIAGEKTASDISAQLPANSKVCMNTKLLPSIFQQILLHSILESKL